MILKKIGYSFFLFILCDVEHHGNAKVIFTLYVFISCILWDKKIPKPTYLFT